MFSNVSMAKTTYTTQKRPVEQYEQKGKQRTNNPPVGLVDAKSSDAAKGRKKCAYDPQTDPTLIWAGKAERTSFEIPTVSLHIHERISLPFALEKHSRVGLNIVDDRGIESLKIIPVE